MRLLLLVGLLCACGDSANTQYLPIGSRCGSNGDCGTSPYDCAMAPQYPGGYCEKQCATGQDCPTDSVCVLTVLGMKCRRSCVSSDDPQKGCRVTPPDNGYVCKSEQNVLVCDIP